MSEPAAAPQWRPAHSPWLVTLSVLLATFMQVLDTSVANVSLPHIAGSLSASTDEATWVLTSYLVASAIVLAATGWLSSFFGRKRYLMFSVLLFTAASAACGMAQSLPQLIIARVLQGIGGGGLQPLAQAIMVESFSKEERGAAMAAFGMGIVVAPIIGPILGGWITDNYSWRWIFYINVPIGLLGLTLQQMFVEDPPYLARTRGQRIDYIGLGLMVLAIGVLQLVLDQGQEADWFASKWICLGAAVVLVSMPLFIIWEVRRRDPFINLRLLKNRNLAMGTLLIAVMGAILYGSTAMLPIFMQRLLNYPALQSGFAMMPRGIGSFISMVIIGKLVMKVENRLLLFIGFFGVGVTCLQFAHLNTQIAQTNIIWPQFLNGLSMGFLFVPMAVLALSEIHQHDINQATGVFSLLRNIGASIGISLIFTFQARMAQTHQVALVSNITNYTPAFRQWAAHVQSYGVGSAITYGLTYLRVTQQASMLAFLDAFRWLAVMSFICCPLVFLFHKIRSHKKEALAETMEV
ncbi:MAG: DHA2 family efflux MFS transporter permease subunit [Elusimicrobiales bacterium]|nr:DHA2 family efflux MFS transporter permease subunit [Elusimicrobiales bacterium]